ncbi:MAG: Hpt domain-containing protein, partial [Steroidobacteraceae bacterium]|nr:Hpt domain-containing protein [Steroidobacteraceae bacterium]
MSDLAAQSIEIAGRELASTIGEARAALEAYGEQPDNVDHLQRCAAELRRIHGVLRVLEIYGAALLAEEMGEVARYVLATQEDRRNHAEALDALMRAMVQLPGYLDRVLAGGRDLALILLPLLNDLRAVRGSPLLSEGTLLLLNLKSDRRPTYAGPAQPGGLQWLARRERPRFQMGLIGWIRGERVDDNLATLAAVAQEFEQRAQTQPVFQLWWVVGALLEALRRGGLEGSVSVKRLLGLADREIKRLYEQGESRYAQEPPVELLNNLLYYIGRATAGGPKLAAVRSSFRLDELLPVDAAIEAERENLSVPSINLMKTVGAAIREDLGRVKDVLDIFARRSSGHPSELAPQVEMLRKIGDTLGVLGLGELRAALQPHVEQLRDIAAGRTALHEGALLEIASALIKVEDALDSSLVKIILPDADAARALAEPISEDFAKVQAAVMRECIANLARLKEAIALNIGGTLDASGLDSWPGQIDGIRAALKILGRERAEQLVGVIAEHLRKVMQPGGSRLPAQFIDRLADALVSIEYYMETLQAGRKEPVYMLDNAAKCLEALERAPTIVVPTVAPVASATATLVAPHAADTEVLAPAGSATPPPAVEPPVLAPQTAVAAPAAGVDPELRAIFIDEARDEIARIRAQYPLWDQNPQERDALVVVRRAFHTLKGSGRMVGARDIGEFAWSVENLLNRLIDGTLSRNQAILDTLRAAVELAPALVEQYAQGSAAPAATAALVQRAHALAAGQAEAAPIAPEDIAAQPAEPADSVAPPPAEISDTDASLREIYRRETSAHIDTVRAWLRRESGRPEPHRLTEEVYRACHTLSGSSKMATARHGVRLAEPLDRWLRKAWTTGVGITAEDLDLLGECMNAMELVATHLDENTGFFRTHDALRARIGAAEAALDARIAAHEAREQRAASAPPAGDFDPEIARIFIEEATELLEQTDAALQAWNASPLDGDRLLDLKRPLHTLKGGARMAGIRAMGALAHELETLIQQIELGAVPADNEAQSLLQQGVD